MHRTGRTPLKWLRRVLRGADCSPAGTAAAAGRQARRGAVHQCRRCENCFRGEPRRCPFCGTKTPFDLLPARPGGKAAPAPTSPGLSDLQRQILIAARDEIEVIYVLPTAGSRPGEVKAGGQRLYGDEAVSAVEDLLAGGYVAVRDEADCFGLTEQGRRLALSL